VRKEKFENLHVWRYGRWAGKNQIQRRGASAIKAGPRGVTIGVCFRNRYRRNTTTKTHNVEGQDWTGNT